MPIPLHFDLEPLMHRLAARISEKDNRPLFLIDPQGKSEATEKIEREREGENMQHASYNVMYR